ncbi:hypothetical protein AOLI_G00277160 [Acnodon oligacanthus]
MVLLACGLKHVQPAALPSRDFNLSLQFIADATFRLCESYTHSVNGCSSMTNISGTWHNNHASACAFKEYLEAIEEKPLNSKIKNITRELKKHFVSLFLDKECGNKAHLDPRMKSSNTYSNKCLTLNILQSLISWLERKARHEFPKMINHF